jgi:hypothetical protein
MLVCDMRHGMQGTYPSAVWRLAVLLIVVPDFVEVILVQLSDKTREVAVLEVLG